MMWSDGGWWMFGWGLHWLLFLAVVALLVWLGMRLARGAAGAEGGEDRALSILRERYARGELSREQYEEMRRDLGG